MENRFLKLLNDIANAHGANLKHPATLWPLHIAKNGRTEFDRGVLSCVAEIYFQLSGWPPEAGKPVPDLGLEPIKQDSESPRGSGRDD